MQKGKGTVTFAATVDDDPLDLADAAHSRTMHKTAAGQIRGQPEATFPMDGQRMVINEEAPKVKPKRKRGGGIDTAASDDSDFDDLHHIRGATAALRISGQSGAASMAGMSGVKSRAKSIGGTTHGGKSTAGKIDPQSRLRLTLIKKRFFLTAKYYSHTREAVCFASLYALCLLLTVGFFEN